MHTRMPVVFSVLEHGSSHTIATHPHLQHVSLSASPLAVCLSVCLSVYVYCLPACLPACLSVFLSVCLSVSVLHAEPN